MNEKTSVKPGKVNPLVRLIVWLWRLIFGFVALVNGCVIAKAGCGAELLMFVAMLCCIYQMKPND